MFRPKKSLGQNFLKDKKAVEAILSMIKKLPCDTLVEVGPGQGALTEGLLDFPVKLILIELDKYLVKKWQEAGCFVVFKDALKVDFKGLDLGGKAGLVGNLPYQIASRLIVARSLEDTISHMVIMVQKEVGQKLVSQVGEKSYGVLSVVAQTFWLVKKALEVPPSSFSPRPKVSGWVLALEKKEVKDLDRACYLRFIKKGFSKRRKKLLSNLGKDTWVEVFKELKFNENIRAEELSVCQWVELFKKGVGRKKRL